MQLTAHSGLLDVLTLEVVLAVKLSDGGCTPSPPRLLLDVWADKQFVLRP